MPVPVECVTCNKVVMLPPSVAKNRKYCSAQCRPLGGDSNPNWKGGLISRNCQVCGSHFEVKQKTVRGGNGIYCSVDCNIQALALINKKQHRDSRVKKNCIVCNKEISVKPSHANACGTYCSKNCMAKDYGQRLAGKNNPNWRHGLAVDENLYARKRREKLKRLGDGYTVEHVKHLFALQRKKCANCKVSIEKGYHVDHIHPVSKGGAHDNSNIQLLCAECNLRKSAKDPIDWANENGRLI